jgi:hypothetical protein
MPIAMHLVDDPYLSARKLLAELCIDIAARVSTGPLDSSAPYLLILF